MTSTMIQYITRLIVVFAFVFALSAPVHGQPPPPPGSHGSEDDSEPAPIGSGLLILLTLAGGYGAKKVYDARKKLQ